MHSTVPAAPAGWQLHVFTLPARPGSLHDGHRHHRDRVKTPIQGPEGYTKYLTSQKPWLHSLSLVEMELRSKDTATRDA